MGNKAPRKSEESLNGGQTDDLYEDTRREPGADLRQTDAQERQRKEGTSGWTPGSTREQRVGCGLWDVGA